MLEVHPVESKEEQKNICALCGIEYNADLLCYAAYVDEILVGASQFKLDKECGKVFDISNTVGIEDENALFVMGRATLNFIDLCGVHLAEYVGKICNESLLKQIGYRKNDSGAWTVNLLGFFEAPCQHGGNK